MTNKTTAWQPHLASHGVVWYFIGEGHVCPVDDCEINHDPKNLELIFQTMDRNEWHRTKRILVPEQK